MFPMVPALKAGERKSSLPPTPFAPWRCSWRTTRMHHQRDRGNGAQDRTNSIRYSKQPSTSKLAPSPQTPTSTQSMVPVDWKPRQRLKQHAIPTFRSTLRTREPRSLANGYGCLLPFIPKGKTMYVVTGEILRFQRECTQVLGYGPLNKRVNEAKESGWPVLSAYPKCRGCSSCRPYAGPPAHEFDPPPRFSSEVEFRC